MNPAVVAQRPGYNKVLLHFFELTNNERKPVKKRLMAAFAGSLMFWDIIQPHLVIKDWAAVGKRAAVTTTSKSKNALKSTTALLIDDAKTVDLGQKIQGVTRGPDLSTLDGHFLQTKDVEMEPEGAHCTLLVLKQDQIEMLSMSDGHVVRSFPVHHLKERREMEQQAAAFIQAKSQGLKGTQALKAVKGKISDDAATALLEQELEGQVSCVHWCPYTQSILLGYSSGTVGTFALEKNSDLDLGFTYLKSQSVHTTEITLLKTFPFLYNHCDVTDPLDPVQPREIVVLMVGDASGQFTLWQIQPLRYVDIIHVFFLSCSSNCGEVFRTTKSALIFQSKQHMGRLTGASMCYLPHGKVTHDFSIPAQARFHELNSNHNVLVTACDKGVVHAWRMEQNLKLHLISFFHASRIPQKMTHLLTVPKMIYREFFIPNPEAPLSLLSSVLETNQQLRQKLSSRKKSRRVSQEFSDIIFNDDEERPGTADSEGSQGSKKKKIEPFIAVANLCYEIYCVVGFDDGQLEIWSLSSDPRYCSNDAPLLTRRIITSPITSLSLYCPEIVSGVIHEPANSIMTEFTLVNMPKLEGAEELSKDLHFPHSTKPTDIFVTAHKDGTVVVRRMKVNPLYSVEEYIEFQQDVSAVTDRIVTETLMYFSAPTGNLHGLLPLQPSHVSVGTTDYAFAMIGDFAVYESLLLTSDHQLIPHRYHQSIAKYNEGLPLQQGRVPLSSKQYRLDTSANADIPPSSSSQHQVLMMPSIKMTRSQSQASLLQLTDSGFTAASSLPDVVRDMMQEEHSRQSSSQQQQSLAQKSQANRGASAQNSVHGSARQDKDADNDAQSINSSLPSHAIEDTRYNKEQASSSVPSTVRGGNRTSRQYVGPMETMQRIVSSDLHVAKKDKRLLELFTFEMEAREGAISADAAVDVICQWANEQRPKILKSSLSFLRRNNTGSVDIPQLEIRRDNLKELFSVLEISPEDKLKFVEVAKIAAITASAMKKSVEVSIASLQQGPGNASGPGLSTSASVPLLSTTQTTTTISANVPGHQDYAKMKTVVTKVTYNSMGERVFVKVPVGALNMGQPQGSLEEHKQRLEETVTAQKRMEKEVQETLAAHKQGLQVPRRLKRIPKIFQELLAPHKLPLRAPDDHDLWTEDGLHYFDLKRTIRIARSLFDMRCSKQHGLRQQAFNAFTANPQNIESIPKLTITYFERQYGECSRSMNVSRFKIANFLEACLQYDYFPLIKLLQYMSYLDTEYAESPGFQVAMWLVVETRNVLLSRGSIIFGEPIDKYEHMSLFDTDNTNRLQQQTMADELDANDPDNNSLRVVRFQYVTPLEANLVCDEMLRVKGGFGPDVYMPALSAIAALPTKPRSQCIPPRKNGEPSLVVADNDEMLVDFEAVLEELFRQFLVHNAMICSLENRIFGEAALNIAVTAKPREINTSTKRALIMDDDSGFGPFHAANMQSLKSFARLCGRHDVMRTGTVDDLDKLLQLCKTGLFPPSIPPATDDVKQLEIWQEEENRSYVRFYQLARQKMKIYTIEDKPSYVDMIALLMAWEEQTQGNLPLTLEKVTPGLKELERLIDAPLAQDLLRYLSRVSALTDIDNPAWVMMNLNRGGTQHDTNQDTNNTNNTSSINPYFQAAENIISQTMSEPPKHISLPMDGQWHVEASIKEVSAPMDAPGMLHITPVPTISQRLTRLQSQQRVVLYHHRHVPYATTSWFNAEPRREAPKLLQSTREQTSVLGETLHPATVQLTKAPAALHPITFEEVLPEVSRQNTSTQGAQVIAHQLNMHSHPQVEMAAVERQGLRTSYSRLLSSMASTESQANGDVDVASLYGTTPPAGLFEQEGKGEEEENDGFFATTASNTLAINTVSLDLDPTFSPMPSPPPEWQRQLYALMEQQNAAAGMASTKASFATGTTPRESSVRNNNKPYMLLRQDSVRSNDSNYQEYQLELPLEGSGSSDEKAINERSLSAEDSSAVPLLAPPSPAGQRSRPMTNEMAALTPFLEFKESVEGTFLLSSSLQELLQLDDSQYNSVINPQAPYPQQQQQQQSAQMILNSSTSEGSEGSMSLLDLNRSLASEEIVRRILELKALEEDFQDQYSREKDDFKRRELEKKAMRQRLQRELLMKEREGMRYYRQALDKRSKFLSQGRAQLEDALRLELEDKKQKDLEIQRILEANRSRVLHRQDEKRLEEMAQAERQKEEKERQLMRKEEQRSLKVETTLREQKQKQLAKEKAAADKAWAEQMQDIQRRQQELEGGGAYLASQRRALRSRGSEDEDEEEEEDHDKTEEEPDVQVLMVHDDGRAGGEGDGGVGTGDTASVQGSLASKRSASRFFHDLHDDTRSHQEDDFDVDEDELTRCQEDKEGDEEEEDEDEGEYKGGSTADNTRPSTAFTEAYDATDRHHQVDEDEDEEARLTPFERRIRLLLRNIKEGMQLHQQHPRKPKPMKMSMTPSSYASGVINNGSLYSNKSAGPSQQALSADAPGFFFAQTFTHDIVFNPCANTVTSEIFQRYLSEDVPYVDPAELAAEDEEDRFDPETMAYPVEIDPFADINAAVKQHRKTLESERHSIFSSMTKDLLPEDWQPIFRTGQVDWMSFFKSEQKKFKLMKQMMIAAAENEAKAFDFDPDEASAQLSAQMSQQSGSNSRSSRRRPELSIMDLISSAAEDSAQLEHEKQLSPTASRRLTRQITSDREVTPLEMLARNQSPRSNQRGGANHQSSYADSTLTPHQYPHQSTHQQSSQERSGSPTNHIPVSLLRVLPADVKRDIAPLPFGKVKRRQVVFPQEIKFYQLEVLSIDCVLTIELQCIRGLASMFLHYNKLPSTVKFEESATCSKEKNRWARIAIVPEQVGTYFLAVTSLASGAEYDLWAYATGNSAEENAHVQRVTQMLKKWDVILQHSPEELQIHYPRINEEAKQVAALAAKDAEKMLRQKQAVHREMQMRQADGTLQQILSSEPVIPPKILARHEEVAEAIEEIENIEAYVVKVGRFAMKKEREMRTLRHLRRDEAAKTQKLQQQDAGLDQVDEGDDEGDNNGGVEGTPDGRGMLAATSEDSGLDGPAMHGMQRADSLMSTDTMDTYDNYGNVMRKDSPYVRHVDQRQAMVAQLPDTVHELSHQQSSSTNHSEPHQKPQSATRRASQSHASAVAAAATLKAQQAKGAAAEDEDFEDDMAVLAQENPNQHEDLFSTPVTRRAHSIAMFMPVPTGHAAGEEAHGSASRRASTKIEMQQLQQLEQEAMAEAKSAHASFSLPALSLRYRGSDVQFDKQSSGSRPGSRNGPNSGHTQSQVRFPPVKDAISVVNEAENEDLSSVNSSSQMSKLSEGDDGEDSGVMKLMSRTQPVNQDEDGHPRVLTMAYSFSAADIRERARQQKARMKLLPPELRYVPKPVTYSLKGDVVGSTAAKKGGGKQ